MSKIDKKSFPNYETEVYANHNFQPVRELLKTCNDKNERLTFLLDELSNYLQANSGPVKMYLKDQIKLQLKGKQIPQMLKPLEKLFELEIVREKSGKENDVTPKILLSIDYFFKDDCSQIATLLIEKYKNHRFKAGEASAIIHACGTEELLKIKTSDKAAQADIYPAFMNDFPNCAFTLVGFKGGFDNQSLGKTAYGFVKVIKSIKKELIESSK